MTHAPDSPQWERNERLLTERLDAELHAGRDFMEARLASAFPGMLGRLVAPLARTVWDQIGEAEVRKRVHLHVDVVLAASRAIAAGTEPDAAVAEHLPRALETEEFVHRAHRDHPAFPKLVALTEQGFRERVDAVHRFLAHGDGDDYGAVTRTAFPDRDALAERIRGHLALGERALGLVEEHPGLLRFPRRLQPPVMKLSRDLLQWYSDRVLRELRALYEES